MDLLSDLTWRGLVNQSTHPEQLGPWLASGRRTLYCGFDPTSDSLHVGSLLPVMLLRRFQKAGHKPIPLVGGATGMIGDPSGKSKERNLLSVEQLQKNVEGIQGQLERLLDFSGENGAVLLNNFEWMRGFSYLEFLRDVGKHFQVGDMLTNDAIRNRLSSQRLTMLADIEVRDSKGNVIHSETTSGAPMLGSGISYTEFSYMLLQAYDFVHLNRTHCCELQIGGSDQWGNITAGIDLARRMHGVQLYGMTCPLLLDSLGNKMGKTAEGETIFLAPDRCSPYKFYQYWINRPDADCGSCLRFLTELSHEEIESLDKSRTEQPHLRESQKRLAEELTRLIHGDAGLASAKRASEFLFPSDLPKATKDMVGDLITLKDAVEEERAALPATDIVRFTDKEMDEIFSDVPSKTLPRDRLSGEGLPLTEAFVEAGLAKSKGEARRTIEQGGAYVNNRPRTDVNTKLTAADLASETVLVLRSGKKKYALLRFV